MEANLSLEQPHYFLREKFVAEKTSSIPDAMGDGQKKRWREMSRTLYIHGNQYIFGFEGQTMHHVVAGDELELSIYIGISI